MRLTKDDWNYYNDWSHPLTEGLGSIEEARMRWKKRVVIGREMLYGWWERFLSTCCRPVVAQVAKVAQVETDPAPVLMRAPNAIISEEHDAAMALLEDEAAAEPPFVLPGQYDGQRDYRTIMNVRRVEAGVPLGTLRTSGYLYRRNYLR